MSSNIDIFHQFFAIFRNENAAISLKHISLLQSVVKTNHTNNNLVSARDLQQTTAWPWKKACNLIQKHVLQSYA